MNSNLFVLHTQYNLILATGLVRTTFNNSYSDLILFTDFPVSQEILSKCKLFFRNIIVFTGAYPKSNEKYLNKFKRYLVIFRKLKRQLSNKYDRVFIIDDMCIPEMYCMKFAYKNNREVDFVWLEDGGITYFDNNVKSRGLSSNVLTKGFRKLVFKYIFGLRKFYHLADYMGGHYLLDTAYVTYPKYVRDVYRNKKIIEINRDSFEIGLKSLYDKEAVQISEKSLFIVLDKISVYEDLKKIEIEISKVIEKYDKEGYKIYYKYHPREEDRLSVLVNYNELDRKISIESYYASMDPDKVIILGIKSTGLQTAKLLGFYTISMISKIESNKSEIVKFYKNIGIEIL